MSIIPICNHEYRYNNVVVVDNNNIWIYVKFYRERSREAVWRSNERATNKSSEVAFTSMSDMLAFIHFF